MCVETTINKFNCAIKPIKEINRLAALITSHTQDWLSFMLHSLNDRLLHVTKYNILSYVPC